MRILPIERVPLLTLTLIGQIPTPIRLLREDAKAFTEDIRKLYSKLNDELT